MPPGRGPPMIPEKGFKGGAVKKVIEPLDVSLGGWALMVTVRECSSVALSNLFSRPLRAVWCRKKPTWYVSWEKLTITWCTLREMTRWMSLSSRLALTQKQKRKALVRCWKWRLHFFIFRDLCQKQQNIVFFSVFKQILNFLVWK